MNMLSFPAGKTYDLVTKTLIHAHPIKRGFPKEVSRFINLRATGGYIHAVFEVVDVLEGSPTAIKRDCKMFSPEIQSRLNEYIKVRRATFGFSSEGEYDYRFYILKLYTRIEPPYRQVPNHMSYTHMELAELLGSEKNLPDGNEPQTEGNHPGVWLISANGKMYDHASSFATNGFIDWRQRANYSVGDTVFIYCTRPLMRIMYKCEVVKHSMPFSECIDDAEFWLDKDEYERSKGGVYARLKLLEQVDTPKLSLEALHSHGMAGNPQGPRGLSYSLYAYIDSQFNDFYSEGIFTDVPDSEEFHEGHVRTVLVDIYERSSIARSKCIEYHGCTCSICGLNFGEKYGELGEGFIHVHHLKPLYTIGKDYIVNYREDLIPVCPNCHAMIHRIPNGENMNVNELRNKLFVVASQLQEKSMSNISVQMATATSKSVAQKEVMVNIPKHVKSVGRHVFHTSPKFGQGVIVAETDTTVKIKFNNGTTTTFTKETFTKGLLTYTD